MNKQSIVKASLIIAFLFVMMIAPSHSIPLASNPLDVTLELTQANSSSGFGTGDFGTVHMVDNGINTVTVTVSLNSGWDIIKTGFPGSFAFSDTLSGTPTIGNFSSSLYSGGQADTTQDQHFDGFGYFSDAAATTGPHNGAGLQTVTFTVTQTGLNNVNDLLTLSATPAGDGQVYFAVDAGKIDGNTGLLGVTGTVVTTVPEPGSYALIFAGLGLLGCLNWRRLGQVIGS